MIGRSHQPQVVVKRVVIVGSLLSAGAYLRLLYRTEGDSDTVLKLDPVSERMVAPPRPSEVRVWAGTSALRDEPDARELGPSRRCARETRW